MYKLKELAQRGTAFVAAVGLLSGVASTALPAFASADANALNPLTERSLMLSSSSPGYHYLDGSGNSLYAPPGSGNNGQKTGETFTFRNSSDNTTNVIKGFSFQYCTTSAGLCTGPGNNFVADDDGAGAHVDHQISDDSSHTALAIHYDSADTPVPTTDFTISYFDRGTDLDDPGDDVGWTDASTGWSIETSKIQNPSNAAHDTGKKNYIKLLKAGGLSIPAGTEVKIVFKASATKYITNPGAGAFFVKINDYDSATSADLDDPSADTNTHVIDGGVTVANVMNDSIQIQTKVLETMSFSVGTKNPDAEPPVSANHGTCDPIIVNDALSMGDPDAENSLDTQTAYDTYSYWRLSSNSSGGATVYYSGNTLSNTENDQIQAIGTTASASHTGTEQFGLALDSTADTLDSVMITNIAADALDNTLQFPRLAPHLTPLVAQGDVTNTAQGPTDYSMGTGTISTGGSAEFAFDPNSLTTPVPIANESDSVVTCATGKMRYLANIAATTPAGVYTSRINYIAAPEY
jgi:hypothetical protein